MSIKITEDREKVKVTLKGTSLLVLLNFSAQKDKRCFQKFKKHVLLSMWNLS